METALLHKCASCDNVASGVRSRGVQELEDESLTQLLRDGRFTQEPASRAVAAPSYSSREVT